MYKLKYDKCNLIAKCDVERDYVEDMLYNATTVIRCNVESKKKFKYVNFFFNPKPKQDEDTYIEIVNRILNKNSYMKDFKIKSLEVNFDYETTLEFNNLEKLGKLLSDILAAKGYKTLNINIDNTDFDYKVDEFKDKFKSYKWFKYKSRNKFLEIKLYGKSENINRFEIIFFNVDNRIFRDVNETCLSKSRKIYNKFTEVYECLIKKIDDDDELLLDDGVVEFLNALRMTLDNYTY
ncbi:MAG: hypothetical protein ACRC6U_00020 [Fusobacteriaceae bacterium]